MNSLSSLNFYGTDFSFVLLLSLLFISYFSRHIPGSFSGWSSSVYVLYVNMLSYTVPPSFSFFILYYFWFISPTVKFLNNFFLQMTAKVISLNIYTFHSKAQICKNTCPLELSLGYLMCISNPLIMWLSSWFSPHPYFPGYPSFL